MDLTFTPPPEVRTVLVEDLLHELRTRRLRKASFQRMFVWQQKDIIALLDSMFKGYPIGNLIFWERRAKRSHREFVRDDWYVIDGQQRLRALTGVLQSDPSPPFNIAFNLDTEEFVRASPFGEALLPLHLVLDTAALLEHLRKLPDVRQRQRIDAANRVAKGLRDYRLAITIVRGDETQVEEVFRRINERGAPLTWVDVQHAINWRSDEIEEVSNIQVTRALRHVRYDVGKDTLPDPWSWQELQVIEVDQSPLLRHLRDSLVATAIPLNVPKGLVGQRPAVILHPLDRLAYQVLVDARVHTLHEQLSEHVFGYRTDSRSVGKRQYVNNVSAARAWRKRQRSWGEQGYSCRTDIASFFASIDLEKIDGLLARTEGYAGNSRLLSFLRGWRGRGHRGALPQRFLPSFILANALLTAADNAIDEIPGLRWTRWVDDYALHGQKLQTVLSGIRALESALGKLGLRLSAAKTYIGSPGKSVFMDSRLQRASFEVFTEDELDAEEAETFIGLCNEVLEAPWACNLRDVSFLVTRLKRHPEFFEPRRWAKAVKWMPHAAEHLARLARHNEDFRRELERGLKTTLSHDWRGQPWAQVKLLSAWPSAPRQVFPFLRRLLAETVVNQPAMTPTLAYLLADQLRLEDIKELAQNSMDWHAHRALWLCAGRAGATNEWLTTQLERFEVHSLLRSAWEVQGSEIFVQRRDRKTSKLRGNFRGPLTRFQAESELSARGKESRNLQSQRDLLGSQKHYEPDMLRTQVNQPGTPKAQGDLIGAREHQEHALAAYERILGPEHPDTLAILQDLAVTLKKLGDLTGAREREERVLAAYERILGSEHPDTLSTLQNLAGTLKAQGDLTGAREREERALAAYERILGPEHPDTLRALQNLAVTLYAQGNLTGAREREERALAAYERILGSEHPDTLRTLQNLAVTLYAQGDLTGARKRYERLVLAYERTLGPENPDTLRALQNLARTLKAQGDLTGARYHFERALAAYERIFGSEHPDTLRILENLAVTLAMQGELPLARDLAQRAVVGRERELGSEHPETVKSRKLVAALDEPNVNDIRNAID